MNKKLIGVVIVCLLATCLLVACANSTDENTQTPVKLDVPTISLDGNVVTWDAVANAGKYIVSVDDETVEVTDTSYVIVMSAPGTKVVKVKAVAADTSKYTDSDYSQSVTYTLSVQTLATPSLSVSGTQVSWEAVNNAIAYDVYVDDAETAVRVTSTVYDMSQAAVGSHTVKVMAIAGSAFYENSALSEAATVTIDPAQLATPVVTANDNIFIWATIPNASGYEVFVDGVSVGVQVETRYELVANEYRVYKVAVKALSDNEEFVDSSVSVEVVYEHVKPTLSAPILSVENGVVSWLANANAAEYKVFVNGDEVATVSATSYTIVEPGVYSVRVMAIAADPDNYSDSALSDAIQFEIKAPTSLSEPLYAYSPHLVERIGRMYVLGIANEDNYNLLSDAYKDTLDNYVDNYLCNMPVGEDWTDADFAPYAWMLEEVTDYTGTVGVVAGEKIYRIRLTDGTYLSVAKNNHIGTGGDYITSSVYVENDIWQYWQIVKIADGGPNDYYIYNVGHDYDWYAIRGNAVTDALTDTTRNDGGAELYPMDDSNRAWFVYTLVNVDGAVFDEVAVEDYSGDFVMHNFSTGKVYGFTDGDVSLKQIADYSTDGNDAQFTWTFEKVDYENMTNVYRIRLADGNYLTYGTAYRYEAKTLNEDTSIPEGQAQLFVINPVHGVKNGFNIGHIYDGSFIDGNDGQTRYYALDGAGSYILCVCGAVSTGKITSPTSVFSFSRHYKIQFVIPLIRRGRTAAEF